MANKKLKRVFWLGELKRAKLEKQKYISRMMDEKFSGVDPLDAEAKLTALTFCEDSHTHFLKTFAVWIDDNYPAVVKQQDLPFGPDITTTLKNVAVFKKAFGEAFNIKTV